MLPSGPLRFYAILSFPAIFWNIYPVYCPLLGMAPDRLQNAIKTGHFFKFCLMFNFICQAVTQMIHPQQTTCDVRKFLWKHLQISFKVLAKSLGRNLEETTTFVHLVLKNMLEEDSVDTSTLII